MLTDISNNAVPVSYKPYKSRRIARSILSAEVVAFADLIDDALAIRKQLEFILKHPIPVHMLTDSRSLFNIISKGNRTNEKRIMLDIYAARKAYKALEISNIGFVRSSHSLANGLTKPKVQAALYELLKTAHHEPKVEKWIIRDPQGCIIYAPLYRAEARSIYGKHKTPYMSM